MFTTGFHGLECGRNTNVCDFSQDRTSHLFELLCYKEDDEDDYDEEDKTMFQYSNYSTEWVKIEVVKLCFNK